jgi:hypothetical protein
MRDADRFKLLGTYRTPRLRVGRVLACEYRDRDVVVTGYTAARIPWPHGRPRGHRGGTPGPVVYGALAEAVRRESNQAVAYWFGVTPNTVSLWRKALAVRRTNAGTHTLRKGYGAEPWFARVRAKGRAARWTPERRAERSARPKRRPPAPRVRAVARKARRKPGVARHTPETRAKMRAAAARRLARGQVPNGRAWTRAEDELVLTRSAAEAAKRTARTLTAVYKRRRKLRVPAWSRRAGP